MKTRLTAVTYLGFTGMDKRFSTSMLPWLLKEIRATGTRDKLSVAVEDGCLKAYNGNFEPVIIHRLVDILRASQVPGHPEELFYILHNEKEGLLNCYLFRANSDTEVTDLFAQMREPSPGARGSQGSLAGAVTRNAGFQADSAEHLPWHAPAAPQACYTGLNSSAGGAGGLVRSVSNASALTSLCADLSPSDSHFFEVLYIGKVRISQRKVPESLIDDALNKFAQHEAGKALQRRHSLLSSCGTSVYSSESSENLDEKNGESNFKIQPSTSPLEPAKNTAWKSTDNLRKNDAIDKEFDMFSKERVKKPQVLEPNVLIINVPGKNNLGTLTEDEEKHEELGKVISETASSITQFCQEKLQSDDYGDKKEGSERTEEKEETEDKDPLTSAVEVKGSEGEKENPSQSKPQSLNFDEISRKPQMNRLKDTNRPMPDNKPFLRDRSASIGSLTLKTPITHMIGEQNRTMLFQVGRAELRLISPDRKQVLLQRAFRDVASCVLGRHSKDHFGFVCRENTTDAYACYVFKCESDSVALEVINAIKQAFVAHSELLKKSREKSPNMTCEHCPMLWYHRLCHDAEGMNEKKTHAFILRRIEQLPEDEQDLIVTKYQGGTNHMYEVSEHNAFLMMLLRAHCEAKQQRHVHDTAENRSEFLNQYLGGSTIFMKAKRSLSSGFDHLLKRRASRDDGNLMPEPSPLPEPADPSLLSPDSARGKSLSPATGISDVSPSVIAESSPEEDPEEPPVKDEGTPVNSPMMDIFLKVSDNRPNHTEAGPEPEATWRQAIYEKVLHSDTQGEGELSSSALLPRAAEPPRAGRRSREQLRQLWKLAIQQTVLLVRMERENAKLKENEESSALRRIKLEYSELSNCDAGVTSVWERLLAEPAARVDRHMLTQAVRQGVPRVSRGAVWYFLAEQHGLRAPPPDTRRCPRYHAPYRALLAGLTKHQHAILIDLGRTFPKHGYFAAALGPGQLALYNTLKAYSLLDPEVGYCQGLSFVAGVLLLHMEEQEAFILLRHLMFRRGLRKQYLPDMSALQVQLYQLSRLVRDLEPELHAHLERLDVSAALYAAPWMLTLFTSQFPLGFVVRVFDLIFLDSLDVVFSVSIALLSAHKDGLMLCENCEEAAEYLKHKLPDISKNTYDKVMKTVHSLDISRQLSDYAVEYSVLRDQLPRLWALSETNRALQDNARTMTEQLDSAMDAINNYQKTVTRLESQNKSMDQQLALLSRYVTAHHKQDMPAEIKKIVQNYSKKISFSSKILRLASNEEEEEKDTKKLYKTGQSAPNLFAKISREDVLNAVNKEKNKSPERDRRHFLMKKSQSVQSGLIATNLKQYPLKVLEEKEYKRSDSFQTDMLKESLKEIGKSNSGFFANTHELIRQERMFEQQLKHDFDQNLKKLDEKIEPKSYMDDLSIFQSRKTMSLNIKSASDKGDSGFVTPLSPKDRKEHFKREDSDRKDDSCSIISHPLSDCDVDIKFDGHSTKLKQIRPLRNNSSVGLDAKQM